MLIVHVVSVPDIAPLRFDNAMRPIREKMDLIGQEELDGGALVSLGG
jgi:hypothetical protein